MIVDTVEELRAELRDCLFTPAERRALETELADLLRRGNGEFTPGDDEPPADQTFTAGA